MLYPETPCQGSTKYGFMMITRWSDEARAAKGGKLEVQLPTLDRVVSQIGQGSEQNNAVAASLSPELER
eukprot:scaffold3922_cov85-Skeletonema_dohrnii-CCMP3373.AAC.1